MSDWQEEDATDRRTALKLAVELFSTHPDRHLMIWDVTKTADEFYKWLQQRQSLTVSSVTITPGTPTAQGGA